jgi:hypothetical protein
MSAELTRRFGDASLSLTPHGPPPLRTQIEDDLTYVNAR